MKLGSASTIVKQNHTFQTINVVSIVKSMGTAKDSVKVPKDVQNVARLDMKIVSVKMKSNVPIVKIIVKIIHLPVLLPN